MFSISRQRLTLVQRSLKVLRLTLVNLSSLDLKNLNPVRTVQKVIENNTSIFIESPIHVKVQPIDVNDMKAHNTLTMTLYSRGKESSDFQVKQTAQRLELLNKNTKADRSDVCVVEVPYQLKVQVNTTEGASVEMSKLEGEEFIIKTDKGDVELRDLKANVIQVETAAGTVESEGRLQASTIDLKTGGQSPISCNNIMANRFIVSTHAGQINVKSCYSDEAHFMTLMGNINLNHLHKTVTVDVIQHGNLHITSFAGTLQASLKSGNVYMLASQLTDKCSIFIHEKGKVVLLMPDLLKNLPATNLIADKISVDDKIMKLGRFMDDSHPKRFRFEKEPNHELHIVCKNGSIDLKESNKIPFLTSITAD